MDFTRWNKRPKFSAAAFIGRAAEQGLRSTYGFTRYAALATELDAEPIVAIALTVVVFVNVKGTVYGVVVP